MEYKTKKSKAISEMTVTIRTSVLSEEEEKEAIIRIQKMLIKLNKKYGDIISKMTSDVSSNEHSINVQGK